MGTLAHCLQTDAPGTQSTLQVCIISPHLTWFCCFVSIISSPLAYDSCLRLCVTGCDLAFGVWRSPVIMLIVSDCLGHCVRSNPIPFVTETTLLARRGGGGGVVVRPGGRRDLPKEETGGTGTTRGLEKGIQPEDRTEVVWRIGVGFQNKGSPAAAPAAAAAIPPRCRRLLLLLVSTVRLIVRRSPLRRPVILAPSERMIHCTTVPLFQKLE